MFCKIAISQKLQFLIIFQFFENIYIYIYIEKPNNSEKANKR